MKITTGGTGIISSQSSMVASTLGGGIGGGGGGVEPGLNYDYTWAFDFSKLTATTELANFQGNFTQSGSGLFSDGVRGVATFSSASGAGFFVDESAIPTASHSNGSAGSEIPNNALPDPTAATGTKIASDDVNVVGHGGRYISIVCTFHKYDIDTSHSSQPTGINLQLFTEGTAGQIWWFGGYDYIPNFADGKATHLNGSTNPPEYQADYDAIIDQISVITFDHVGAYVNGNPSADPLKINILPCHRRIVDMDITFHGIIFSDTPPNAITTLPIEITSPTIGSGPA